MECKHQLDHAGTLGNGTFVYRCQKCGHKCTSAPTVLINADGSPIPVCDLVNTRPVIVNSQPIHAEDRTAQQMAAYPCIYRGEQIDTDENPPCHGGPQPIFACSVHGTCALSHYCSQQKAPPCSRCKDRKEELLSSTSGKSESSSK